MWVCILIMAKPQRSHSFNYSSVLWSHTDAACTKEKLNCLEIVLNSLPESLQDIKELQQMYILAEEIAHELKCFFYLQSSFTRQSVTASGALFINNVCFIHLKTQ